MGDAGLATPRRERVDDTAAEPGDLVVDGGVGDRHRRLELRRVREEGVELAGALAILDRLAGGGEAIEAALGDGLPYVALFTIDDVYPDRPDR
jgi:orotate phosphoribosyltransferase